MKISFPLATEIKERLMIAAFMGFEDFVFRGIERPQEKDYVGTIRTCYGAPMFAQIPDYFGDHDAIQEVIDNLNTSQLITLGTHLQKMMPDTMLQATAAQKAKGVLLTILC